MNIDDFWCRAFLAAMGDHTIDLERCEEIANGALWRAQKNGMVPSALPGNDMPADPTRPASTLERVEFTAHQLGDRSIMWILRGPRLPSGGVEVDAGEERVETIAGTFRIRWGETSPPKPIEVWLERPAASPAPLGMSDAEVAAAFYDRFRPVRVLFGSPVTGIRRAFIEDDGDIWTSGMARATTEDHPAGEPGFVAAALRARELVRKGGA